MKTDFATVTELANEEVPMEQVERLSHRYYWAGEYCQGRDVLEVACGAGQGLGYLASVSNSVRAGDITSALVTSAHTYYGSRIEIIEMDAQSLPFSGRSMDVVILFEAIYYLPSAEHFVNECRRVLRPGGRVLIVTANKDLYDFNPSPFSQQYYGVVELGNLFGENGFSCEFFGNVPVDTAAWRQQILRPIKALAVKLNLMPKTMSGKKLLKRLVFGNLVPMPAEINRDSAPYTPPEPISPAQPDRKFKAIYLSAILVE